MEKINKLSNRDFKRLIKAMRASRKAYAAQAKAQQLSEKADKVYAKFDGGVKELNKQIASLS